MTKENFIASENCIEKFNPEALPACNNGDVTVGWFTKAPVDTGNRAYQREKVATIRWKQNILRTILVMVYAGIPEIHIRVIKTETGYKFEVIDGQQRISAPLGYLAGEFPMPNNMKIDGMDISGMWVDELREKFPAIVERLEEYRLSCKWYEGLSDSMTSDLYVNVLNNVNDQKPQEIRNAVLGFYSTYVRDTARFKTTADGKASLHDLFTRVTTSTKSGEKTVLKYFSSKFSLKGRMEVDEWLSELIYFWKNDFRSGITQAKHYKWVVAQQSPTGEYATGFTDKKKIDDLLNFALSVMKVVPKTFKEKLNPMTSLILVLYAADLKKRFGDVVPETYSKSFFDVYERWSDTSKKLYANEVTDNGSQMPPFAELFGGKNGNAIKTIISVLDRELIGDPLSPFDDDVLLEKGIIRMDMREVFKRADIIKKWKEQGGRCYYTGEPLDEEDIAGDHYIPRSWGIARGGVTEYDNLVVCSKDTNRKKGNMSGDDYIAKLKMAA
jgi:hypothetical protein|tara:strand:- start:1950 stop:3443 length:1494 start_codon:yes stop_codon:yes gene_type:complete